MSLSKNVLEQESTVVSQENSGVLASLGINGQLFVFQLINFILVAGVIWFFILKPLTKKMTERQKMIDDSIDNAKKVQDNLTRSEKEYQNKIDMAKAEANRILEKACENSESTSAAARTQVKLEIEKLVEQARKKNQNEKADMLTALRKESVNLIALALEKIIGDKMDTTKDKKIIEESLRNLK